MPLVRTAPAFIALTSPPEPVAEDGQRPNRQRRRALAVTCEKRVRAAKKGIAKALDRNARKLLIAAFEKSKR